MVRPAAPALRSIPDLVSEAELGEYLVKQWSKGGAQVICCCFVLAHLKRNRIQRKKIILWALETQINLFLKESEEWGKKFWKMETQR